MCVRLLSFSAVVCVVLTTTWCSPNLYAASDPGGGGGSPPSPTIADVITHFDEAVADGTLQGEGRHFILRYINLWRMRVAIEKAQLAYDELELQSAHGWLAYAYLRCDSSNRPLPDWVSGPAVPELKSKTLAVMTQIAPLL